MDQAGPKTFHCAVISPLGTLLDCQAVSVVFPAHDGQVGVLHDHMPMLSQLGLGLLKVTAVSAEAYQGPAQAERQFFVDGGFALVAENSITVIAYDALALQGLKPGKLESLIERTTRNLASTTLSDRQRQHEHERLRALRRTAEAAQAAK